MISFSSFVMSVTEGTKIAFRSLRLNKTRAFLTTTCIVIGIVSVTAMNTVTDGIDRSFEESMDMLGRNVLFVEKWPWGFGGEYKWWDYRNRPEMQLDYVEQLRERLPDASAISAAATRSATIRYVDREVENVDVNGATAEYFQTAGLDIAEGRPFTENDVIRANRVAVVGQTTAESLFPGEDPLGKRIRIQGQPYTVIGVLEPMGNFLGMEDGDTRTVIPVTAFGSLYSLRYGIQLAVQFPEEAMMADGEYEVIGAMRQIRRLDPLEKEDFAINKAALFEQQFESIKALIYGIGIFLTGLALFVGGIGVMNIMYVSVKERTREIGIRKSVGARSWEILLQFLMEAIVICLLGGAVGVVLSLGVTVLLNQFFIAYMSWGTVVQALLICTAIGVLFGYLPSSKAAKADPIESLGYA